MSFLGSFVYSAKIVGVVTSGLMAGYCSAASFGSVPALLAAVPPDAPAEHQQILAKVWLPIYKAGAATAIPSILTATAAYLFASYQRYHHPALTRTAFGQYTGIGESAQLALAGLLIFAVGPFTRIAMEPTVNHSLQVAARTPSSVRFKDGGKAIREDIKDWIVLNNWRVVGFTASFIIGVLSL